MAAPFLKSHSGLVGCLDDGNELLGHQGGAADEAAVDIGLFEAFTRGFLEGAPSLTPQEVDTLPLGAFTMTLECGSRFLADYLNGDTYFRVAYPEHNLIRTRTQIAMCADMLRRWDEMTAVIEKLR